MVFVGRNYIYTEFSLCHLYRKFYHLHNYGVYALTFHIHLVHQLFSVKGIQIGSDRTKTQVMNKCIAFFIVLVFVLVVAVLTDNERTASHENNLVEHKVDTNKKSPLVDNKAVAGRRY